MHGRLKVRSTEEQEERKRLEREKKLKYYKHGMSECLKRVKDKQYDEVGYKISEEILASNGDVQTLWNYRRNCLLAFENSFCQPSAEEGAANEAEDKLAKYYVNEMNLTEVCLKKNPKSYGSWYHRQWCLIRVNDKHVAMATKHKQLSWTSELALCNQFLNADERNFHCWRHRSFVNKYGALPLMDELKFTYEKICSNFSNYSSWHYRSKLIESLYQSNQIDSKIFLEELQLMENAVFTDPNDQSAWIYQKWLLLEYQRSDIRSPELDARMQEHLNNIQELSRLENDNSKWCLLSLVELMSLIDLKKYEPVIMEYLDKLADQVDTYRKNFYLDYKKKLLAK